MSTEHSIVVVDDAKFSAAIVAKKLKTAGYKDVRTAHHADDAIKLLNESKVPMRWVRSVPPLGASGLT